MSDRPLICVLDANVVLKLFFEQPGSDHADVLFKKFDIDPAIRFYVPEFFYAECASAFVNYARLTDYTMEQAREDMADLLALALYAVATPDLSIEALDIALAEGISGYDAFYVALSQRLNAPLITADEKLVQAFANKPYRVELLHTFEI
jgi:predicted nucleic acid-binding protein